MSEAKRKVDRRSAVYRELRGVLGFLIVFVFVASNLITAATIYELASHATTNRRTINDTHTGTQILIDCTTPGHKCYDDSQKQLAQTIGSIEHIVVLAAACAKQPQNVTVTQIEACVTAGLH